MFSFMSNVACACWLVPWRISKAQLYGLLPVPSMSCACRFTPQVAATATNRIWAPRTSSWRVPCIRTNRDVTCACRFKSEVAATAATHINPALKVRYLANPTRVQLLNSTLFLSCADAHLASHWLPFHACWLGRMLLPVQQGLPVLSFAQQAGLGQPRPTASLGCEVPVIVRSTCADQGLLLAVTPALTMMSPCPTVC